MVPLRSKREHVCTLDHHVDQRPIRELKLAISHHHSVLQHPNDDTSPGEQHALAGLVGKDLGPALALVDRTEHFAISACQVHLTLCWVKGYFEHVVLNWRFAVRPRSPAVKGKAQLREPLADKAEHEPQPLAAQVH